jgi:2-polyprenyl-6-methoxyphenol hydroxylase-like FAD-dependent oxidoreductase
MTHQQHRPQTTTDLSHPLAATVGGSRPEDTVVAIVGGSLVGPATELFLRRQGWRNVVTYEALPAARSQSGGVMGLRQDTIDLLAELGVDIPAIQALDDRNVYAYDLTDHGAVQRGVSAFPGVVTSWDALHAQLRRLVDVHTSHRLVGMDTVDGRWRLRFAHRPDAYADVVLFADGRHSTGRALLDPDRALRYNGYVVWRGLATPPATLPYGFERYYDIRHARLFSITAPLRQSGRSYWELSHNLPEQAYTAIAGAGPTERAFLLPQHIDASARAMIRDAARYLPDGFTALIENSEVAGIPVNDTTMPDRAVFHSSGSSDGSSGGGGGPAAVLLGDALLPVRLQVGAGLNQGLRQAAELTDTLTRALTGADRAERLAGWERRTLDRLAPWVEQGRSRAHRNNLGVYEPVRPGRTTAPAGDQWAEPTWVSA